MNDDPDFDGASLLVVGERILDAARERPTLGLALGRAAAALDDPGQWFIGTRVAREPERSESDVRFDGGAPPLSALARRIEVGEFGLWFGELKADADAGRVHPVRLVAKALARAAPERSEEGPTVHRVAFPAAGEPPVRVRGGRR